MKYRFIIVILLSLLLLGCEQSISNKKIKVSESLDNRYKNVGFALIYNEELSNIKKLEPRSLDIYHKFLKKKSTVKITNLKNGNFLIAHVKSNRIKFSSFYNSVLSSRIAETLDLDLSEPYVEIILMPKNSTFVAKKAKTYEEERTVAEKAPIDGIQIKDLSIKKKTKKKLKNEKFSYTIKVADFYYKDTAMMMVDRIKNETAINNIKILRLSETKYRVLIGPFNDIKTLKDSFEKMNFLNFENLEVLRNV